MKRILFAAIITALAIGRQWRKKRAQAKRLIRTASRWLRCAQQLPEKMQTGGMRAKGGEHGGKKLSGAAKNSFHAEM